LGLLSYRAELHKAGLQNGEQWIFGSFVEHPEIYRNTPPGDIDLLTILYPSRVVNKVAIRSNGLDNRQAIKERYGIDLYYLDMDDPLAIMLKQLTYWLQFVSYTRGNVWKGFVSLGLGTLDTDQLALESLTSRETK
jgi:hypothetical protein